MGGNVEWGGRRVPRERNTLRNVASSIPVTANGGNPIAVCDGVFFGYVSHINFFSDSVAPANTTAMGVRHTLLPGTRFLARD